MTAARVLVVEDEPSVRALLVRMLELRGFAVVTATTCHEAIRAAETGTVHAVVLDLKLHGGSSGLDLLAWCRSQARYATTPVLILTGAVALEEDEEERIRRDRAYVFYKPQQYRGLIDRLERLVSR